MKGLAGHEDGPAPVSVHDDHDARMLHVALGDVHVNAIPVGADATLHGAPSLVAADGREQVDLGVAAANLREGDAAATGGDEARITQVDDGAGLDEAVETPERHVLDMADDGDAGGLHETDRLPANL